MLSFEFISVLRLGSGQVRHDRVPSLTLVRPGSYMIGESVQMHDEAVATGNEAPR